MPRPLQQVEGSVGNKDLAPWAAIEKYFDLAILSVANKRRAMGCLLVNSFCESINYDKDIQKTVKSSYAVIRKAFLARTKEAEKAGALKKGVSADLAAEVLTNSLSGLRVGSREGKNAKQLGELVQFTIASLQ